MGEPRKIKTVCGYCGTGCGLILEVEDNKIVKARGDKEAPVNKGKHVSKVDSALVMFKLKAD